MVAFELEQFTVDCKAALATDAPLIALREVVARVVSYPASVMRELGEPTRGQLQKLYQSDELTILNIVWLPNMVLLPHDHRMRAVIGIYTGREDNIFWKRVPGGPRGKVEAVAAKALQQKDALPLGPDIIHSVTNPIPRLTGAIHVYTGDFFNVPRSEWDPETLEERPCDVDAIARRFEAAT